MKKLLATTAAMTLAIGMMGQLNVGAKAGLNYSSYGTSVDPEPTESIDPATGIGFHLGGYAEFMFSDNIGLRPELLYSARMTSSTTTTTTTYDFLGSTVTSKTESKNKGTLSYLEIPILLNFKANDNLSFQAGPGLGMLLSSKTTSDQTTSTTTVSSGGTSTSSSSASVENSSTDGLRGLEIGAAVGAVYELESGLNFGLRYWRGLNTLNKDTDFAGTTIKTTANVIQFSIGYTFLKG